VGVITLLMAATMLVISVVFLRAGRELTQGLAGISSTMTLVGSGNRAARVGSPVREDELGQLSRDFNGLLDLITHQEEMRRAAVQTIADEASRRRALFEHERDGVVILNPDGSVFEANPQCLTMLGYRAAEMQQLHLGDWEMQPPPAKVQQLLLGVGPPGTQYETVHRRKDGSTYAAEVSISRVAWADHTFVLASQRDITERKLTEVELERYRQGLEVLVEQRTKELNDRGEQLNAIFALSPDGFVSFDRELRVSFVNASFLRMTALASGEILGLDETAFSDLLARRCVANAHFPGVARLRSAREKVGADGTAPDTGSGRRQSFELLPPASRVLEVGIRLAETENVSQILYFRDITHETEVDRMKSEFLSTAAHELRTPMASIYGYTELLMMQDFDEDMRKEMLGTIYRQSELISSIVNELLDLARIEARQGKDFVIERILLGELVDHARAAYKPPAGREAPVVEVCPPGHAIHADRKKMQQALLNILSNAYKYSPQGGPVSIACRLDAGPAGLRAGIEVRDQGIGMTPDQLSHIFERFYRADTSGKIPGTGLGMSIVKEITELHGGSVEVASTPGAGTRVTLWIAMA
jgi:PAS domain S-box-containing protein